MKKSNLLIIILITGTLLFIVILNAISIKQTRSNFQKSQAGYLSKNIMPFNCLQVEGKILIKMKDADSTYIGFRKEESSWDEISLTEKGDTLKLEYNGKEAIKMVIGGASPNLFSLNNKCNISTEKLKGDTLSIYINNARLNTGHLDFDAINLNLKDTSNFHTTSANTNNLYAKLSHKCNAHFYQTYADSALIGLEHQSQLVVKGKLVQASIQEDSSSYFQRFYAAVTKE